MIAYLIDPVAKAVMQIEFDGSINHLYALIGCDMVQFVRESQYEGFWINEEGLLKPEPGPFWSFAARPETIFEGKAVWCSLDPRGEEMAGPFPFTSQWALAGALTWPRVRFVRMDTIQGMQDHPVFGRISVVERKAVFEPLEAMI